METKFLCDSIIKKSINYDYRSEVQIAIKYLVLGIFQIFGLVLNFISLDGLTFKKNHLYD